MRNITFNFSNMHEHGPAFYNFLRLRKRFFVDGLGWEIPHNDDVEMDQYDTPQAHYSLVIDGDEVLAGARVSPTSSHWGDYTFMLGDAHAGKLPGLPKDRIGAMRGSSRVWECTRLVISDKVVGLSRRTCCLELVVDGLVRVAMAGGATEMTCLSFGSLQRALRRIGYSVRCVGEPFVSETDGRTYAVLSMPARRVMKTPLDAPEGVSAHRLLAKDRNGDPFGDQALADLLAAKKAAQ